MTKMLPNPARRLAALALTAVLAAGCGGDATPADAAPELAEQLARVDRAVATGEERQIRERVEALIAATEAALEAGQLDDEQADGILAAADALLRRLPAEPTPKPSPSPSTSSPTTPSPDDEDDEDDEKDDPKEEKPEKPEKSDESGPGKGKGHKGKSD